MTRNRPPPSLEDAAEQFGNANSREERRRSCRTSVLAAVAVLRRLQFADESLLPLTYLAEALVDRNDARDPDLEQGLALLRGEVVPQSTVGSLPKRVYPEGEAEVEARHALANHLRRDFPDPLILESLATLFSPDPSAAIRGGDKIAVLKPRRAGRPETPLSDAALAFRVLAELRAQQHPKELMKAIETVARMSSVAAQTVYGAWNESGYGEEDYSS